MRASSSRASRRAFSLFEVVVAIAVMLALVGVLFTTAFGTWDGRDRLAAALDAERSLALVIDRVDRALLVASAGGDGRVGGDERSLEIAHRAVRGGAGRGSAMIAADCVLRVRFDEDSGRLSVGLDGAALETLPGVHRRVRFRFHDGADWRDAFDGDGLPHAIEIAVWSGRPAAADDELVGDGDGTDGDRASSRRTFDDTAGFAADLLGADGGIEESEIPPDRLRVIAVTDPGVPSDGAGAFDDSSGGEDAP